MASANSNLADVKKGPSIPKTNSGKRSGKSLVSHLPVSKGNRIHRALAHSFGYCLIRAATRFRTVLETELLTLQIGPPHLALLMLLENAGTTNQVRLGEELGIDKATMVKLIDLLERLKLVARKAGRHDRRENLVTITRKGSNLRQKGLAAVKKAERILLPSLDRRSLNQLRSSLAKLT